VSLYRHIFRDVLLVNSTNEGDIFAMQKNIEDSTTHRTRRYTTL